MKHRLLRIIPLLLLGGVLGLTAAPAAFEAAGVKAEDANTIVFSDFTEKGASHGGDGEKFSFYQSPITVSTTGGYSTKGSLRVYADKKLEIKSSTFNIESIDFTFNSGTKATIENYVATEPKTKIWSKTMTAQTIFDSITVKLSTDDVKITDLSIDTSSAITVFSQNDTFTTAGLKVYADSDNLSHINVTDKCQFSVEEGTKLTELSQKTITVTYAATNSPSTDSGLDISKTYNILVKQAEQETCYKKVTKNSNLNVGDKILFVDEASSRASKEALTPDSTAYKHYLDTAGVTINDGVIKASDSTAVTPFKIAEGSTNGTVSFFSETQQKYLSIYSLERNGFKWVSSVDALSSFIVNVETTNTVKVSSASKYNDNSLMKYSTGSGGNFRMATETSGNKNASIYKYESGAERIYLNKDVYEGHINESTSIVASFENVSPTSIVWSTTDDNVIEIVDGQGTSSLNIKCVGAGSTVLSCVVNNSSHLKASCVITVAETNYDVLDNDQYFIIDKNSIMLGKDLLSISDYSLADISNQWQFIKVYATDNSYYLFNGEYYLEHVGGSPASKIALVSNPSQYWVASTASDGKFTLKCSDNTYLATYHDLDKNQYFWRAFQTPSGGQELLSLTDCVTPVSVTHTGTLQKTSYNVGDSFDPKGLSFFVNYSDEITKLPLTQTIEWDPIALGTTATGKVTVAGVQLNVTYEGITVTNYQPSEIKVENFDQTTFISGEKIDLSGARISLILKDGEASIERVLESSEYTYSPSIVSTSDDKLTICYKKDPSIKKEINISVLENTYVSANSLKAGDIVVIGTGLSSTLIQITGGRELSYEDGVNSKVLVTEKFGYMPLGLEPLEVGYGIQDKTFSFRNRDGAYLSYNGKTLDFGAEWDHTDNNDGAMIFGYNVVFNNEVEMYINFSDFGSGDYTFIANEWDEDKQSRCDALAAYNSSNGTLEIIADYFNDWASMGDPDYSATITVPAYIDETGYMHFDKSTHVIDENSSFTCTYDEDLEVWNISPVSHPEYTCYYQKDSTKIACGVASSDLMIYRDNTLPLKADPLSFSINDEFVQHEVLVGNDLEWTSLIVTARYPSTADKIIPLGGYRIELPDTSTVGTHKPVNVYYGAKGNELGPKTYYIDVVSDEPTPVEPEFVSISIKTYPTKMSYKIGETFDPTGLTVTAKMTSGPDLVLGLDNLTIQCDGTGKAGQSNVKVMVTEKKSVFLNFKINVIDDPEERTLDGIIVTPGKITYLVGDTFNFKNDGGKVTAVYKTGEKEEHVDVTSNCLFSEVNTSTVQDNVVVTVSFKDPDFPLVQETFNISVKNPPVVQSLKVENAKTGYIIGEDFDPTMTVTATYDYGNPRVLNYLEYEVDSSLFNKEVEGTYQITVTEKVSRVSTTYVVTVSEAPINEIVLTYTSSKTDAKPGDTQELMFNKPFNSRQGETFDMSKFEFSSSDESVAVVEIRDGKAYVNYLDFGHCTITVKAKVGSGIATYQVNVLKHVTGISLLEEAEEVNINETITLHATIEPDDADDKKVIWTSSDESIAKVDANGVVTGIKEGTVTITATANDKVLGTKSASCEVSVKKVPVTSVTLDKITEEALIGDKFKLNATVEPDNATFPEVKWSSSNEKVAKVDQNGNVTCVKEGTATITVINEDSGLSATCVVIVSKIDVESVKLNKETLDLVVGNNETLVATVSPDNATYKDVSWNSSDTSVATVDANGKVIAVAPGTATITVKTNDGEKVATCTVTVRAIPVESVSLNETTAKLDISQTLDLVATVTPENATFNDVTFSTSNADIATVDENGKVTAVAVGEVTITVTTADGAKTATCKVIVYDKAAQTKKNLIVLGATAGGVVVVGAGCGIGIPLGIKASKKRKTLKK